MRMQGHAPAKLQLLGECAKDYDVERCAYGTRSYGRELREDLSQSPEDLSEFDGQ